MAGGAEKIREIADRVAASYGLEIVDLELKGGGKARRLTVFIEHAAPEGGGGERAGVTHEDCANVSREMGTILDVEDAIPGGSYTLEVSSPGLDRRIATAGEFSRFVGSLVKLTTREPVNDNRHYMGRLESFGSNKLTLDVAGGKKKGPAPGKVEIELANVEKANLVPEI